MQQTTCEEQIDEEKTTTEDIPLLSLDDLPLVDSAKKRNLEETKSLVSAKKLKTVKNYDPRDDIIKDLQIEVIFGGYKTDTMRSYLGAREAEAPAQPQNLTGGEETRRNRNRRNKLVVYVNFRFMLWILSNKDLFGVIVFGILFEKKSISK